MTKIKCLIKFILGWKYSVGYDISNGQCCTVYAMVHPQKGVWVYAEKWSSL